MILFEAKNQSCHAILKKIDNKLELSLYGRLDVHSLASLWQPLLHALHSASLSNPITCHVNLTNVDYLDLSGATFLEAIRSFTPIQTQETGLDSRFLPLRKIAPPLPNPLNFSAQRQHSSTISLLGSHVLHILDDLRQQLTFSGKLLKILLSAFICPNSIRWRETLLIFRKCGSDALLIVSLISLLMGMILAFQSAIPLRQFGVDIFVVNLVVLSILRELGVIMTAIVFAGRSASAFAAELGTMRINEEINALITLGLDPDRFLILPRILAGTLAVPILTIYANVIGILGGLFIVTTFGYSWPAVWNQALQAATLPDLFTGIIKSLAFGFLVSAAACLRGFQTQGGAIAVGISTTRSVVSSILLIIISDLLFALVFYSLEF